jgi:hypothetical protein
MTLAACTPEARTYKGEVKVLRRTVDGDRKLRYVVRIAEELEDK